MPENMQEKVSVNAIESLFEINEVFTACRVPIYSVKNNPTEKFARVMPRQLLR